jgi:hypothetical protein
MRWWWLWAGVVGGCGGGAAVAPVKVDFVEVRGVWHLSNPEPGKTAASLHFGDRVMDFGLVEGQCEPSPTLPFTEVQGQKAFAALTCSSPDGGKHHAVLVEVLGPEADWPAPVALGLVLSRTTGEGSVAVLTMGAAEVPLGLVPLPPEVSAAPEPSAGPEPSPAPGPVTP